MIRDLLLSRDPNLQRRSDTKLACLLLLGLVAITFGRTVFFEFNIWDDEPHVANNTYLKPFNARSAAHFWSAPHELLYIPVTYTLWGLIAGAAQVRDSAGRIELNPQVFHLANVCTHAANVLLVFWILRRIVKAPRPALFGAAVFAVHPLQVEAVSWVSGFRDLAGAAFALVTIALWLIFDARRSRTRWVVYAFAGLCSILAVLAKPGAAVAMPMAWIAAESLHARSGWRERFGRMLPAVPFALLAGCVLFVTSRIQSDAPLMTWNPPWIRPIVALDALAWYLFKLVFPYPLGPDYGRTPAWLAGHAWLYLSWIAPVALVIAVVILRKRIPVSILAAASLVLVALLPVLGFVPFLFQQYSTVADRYMYLPMLGVGLTAACAVAGRLRASGSILCSALVLLLAAVSFRQAGVWRDSESLHRWSIRVNPASMVGYLNLSISAERAGRTQDALRYARIATEIAPDDARAHLQYSRQLAASGDSTGARRELALGSRAAADLVIRRDPGNAFAHRRLGSALIELGNRQQGISELRESTRLDPADPANHLALGEALFAAGFTSEAVQEFKRVVALAPPKSAAADAAASRLAIIENSKK